MKIYQTDFAKVFFGGKKDSLTNCELLVEKPITFGHQVHEAELLKVNDSPQGSKCLLPSSDGLLTEKKNLPLGLYTADCVPCVLATQNLLFSLHLGWRGVYEGLLKKALSFVEPDTQLEVFVGPHILYDSFEVQEDLVETFKSKYPDAHLWSKEKSGHFYISLMSLIKIDLSLNHPRHTLYFDERDTFTSTEHFSYRADNKTTKRNLTLSFLRS